MDAKHKVALTLIIVDIGNANCDGNSINGCEALLNSTSSCGLCSTNCLAYPNVNSASCVSGNCVITNCSSGYSNCDGNVTNGCESPLDSFLTCGSCKNNCLALPNVVTAACNSGLCSFSCHTGFGDCDSIVSNGCENPLNSTSNCGTCLNNCTALPHVSAASCKNSVCSIAICDAGYDDCNKSPTDGCETDLTTSLNNCGACGTNCTNLLSSLNVVAATCSVGDCTISTCQIGFQDCDGVVSNGCETSLTANTSCGTCNNNCAALPQVLSSSCSLGSCVINSCANGFNDCDGNVSNGCETTVQNSTTLCSCGFTCATNYQCVGKALTCSPVFLNCSLGTGDCDGNVTNGCETDLNSSVNNCGKCNNNCAALPQVQSASCSLGVCVINSCAGGFSDCDGNVLNGCETSIQLSNTQCGCGFSCSVPNANSTCQARTCQLLNCAAGFGNCDGDPSNGCEVNFSFSKDLNNCGSCGNICSSTNGISSCINGRCSISCTSPFFDCDGNNVNGCEVNLSTNQTSCGSCNNTCGANTNCVNSNCVCNANFGNCDGVATNGCETNFLNSVNNCGKCGTKCPQGGCTQGACSCLSDSFDCDNNPANGCEVNVNSDVNNCGGCGIACALTTTQTTTCSNKVCVNTTCPPLTANCDYNSLNGCEVTLNTNINCASCGDVCSFPNANSQCVSSQCSFTCKDGYSDADGIQSNGCETLTIDPINVAPPETQPGQTPSNPPPPSPPALFSSPSPVAIPSLGSPPAGNSNPSPTPPPPGANVPVSSSTVVSTQTISLSSAAQTNQNTNSQSIPVTLSSNSGSSVGTLQIPNDVILGSDQVTLVVATTDISQMANGAASDSSISFSIQGVSSSVITILLYDSFGQPIHTLNSPITICLSSSSTTVNSNKLCLAYETTASGSSQWVCQSDVTLNSDNQFCGETPHLTNFALLLQGGGKNDHTEFNNTLSWISLAFIIFAIILCVVSSVVYDLQKRIRNYREDQELKTSFNRHESLAQSRERSSQPSTSSSLV